jgi:mono/diheme cytochrome c family protein
LSTPGLAGRALVGAAAVLSVLCTAAGCGGGAPAPAAAQRPAAPGPAALPATPELIARGAYLARVGNCAGCHTAPGGAPMAGGVRLQTPYGAVYAGNLTPEPKTGLGLWRADEFHRAMHEGRGRDGRRLIPAFPYTSFTRVAREDNDALFAYLRSLQPVEQAAPPNELRFPYGTQAALAVWQWLNFTPAAAAAQAPTAGLARGEYLVRGLGHCGECHAPRNRWSAPGDELSGGEVPGERWYAPSLHPQPGDAHPAAQTVQLLRDGLSEAGTAAGPMARVVLDSTQHWRPDDLALAARYLASLPRSAAPEPAAPADPALMQAGARIYADLCAGCHGAEGRGAPGVYPALAGNPGVTQPNIRNLVQVLRHGGFPPSTAGNPRPYGMPPAELSDGDTAAVLSYLRQSWGQQAPAVSALDVMKAR